MRLFLIGISTLLLYFTSRKCIVLSTNTPNKNGLITTPNKNGQIKSKISSAIESPGKKKLLNRYESLKLIEDFEEIDKLADYIRQKAVIRIEEKDEKGQAVREKGEKIDEKKKDKGEVVREEDEQINEVKKEDAKTKKDKGKTVIVEEITDENSNEEEAEVIETSSKSVNSTSESEEEKSFEEGQQKKFAQMKYDCLKEQRRHLNRTGTMGRTKNRMSLFKTVIKIVILYLGFYGERMDAKECQHINQFMDGNREISTGGPKKLYDMTVKQMENLGDEQIEAEFKCACEFLRKMSEPIIS